MLTLKKDGRQADRDADADPQGDDLASTGSPEGQVGRALHAPARRANGPIVVYVDRHAGRRFDERARWTSAAAARATGPASVRDGACNRAAATAGQPAGREPLDVSGTWLFDVQTRAGIRHADRHVQAGRREADGPVRRRSFGERDLTGTVKGNAISFGFDDVRRGQLDQGRLLRHRRERHDEGHRELRRRGRRDVHRRRRSRASQPRQPFRQQVAVPPWGHRRART